MMEQSSTGKSLDEVEMGDLVPRLASHISLNDTNRSDIGQFPQDERPIASQNALLLPGIKARRASVNGAQIESEDLVVFVVGYEGEDDPLKPHNWRFRTRILATVNIGIVALVAGMASAIDSATISRASEEFGVSKVVESLATGLFLVGFGCSGPFAGPMSETFGRNPVYICTLSLFMVFIMASGLAPNIGAQLIFRFLAGFFASTPFTTAGGSLSDIWSPLERVYTFPIFAVAGFIGPVLGPVIGGFIAESPVSWRWTEWTTLIMSGIVLVSFVLFQPETFEPILLKWKAAHIRVLSADTRYRAPVELHQISFITRLWQALCRPFLLTATEPIIILFSLYLSVVYIVLFGFLAGYEFIFKDTYDLSQGITGLLFLGIGVGVCFTVPVIPLIYTWTRREIANVKAVDTNIQVRLPPETRLWMAMLGAPALPISLFWMAWTSFDSISYWSPLIASVFFGFGILTIFISIYQYVIDSYERYAGSALAMTTLVRFVAAGGMIEVTIPMYENLGVHWTLTMFACISLVLTPLPYLFYRYGAAIRRYSRHAVA
jgi:MFS family permease